MKICLINHSYPPKIGGGETIVHELATEFYNRGHEVTVITGGNGLKEISITEQNNIKILKLNKFYKFEKGLATLQEFLPQLKRSLLKSSFDVIHVHNFMPGLAMSVLSHLVKTKVIFTFHSGPSVEEGRVIGVTSDWDCDFALAKFIINQNFYSALICPSNFYLNWGEKLGAPQEKLRMIHHGINLDKYIINRDQKWREINNYSQDDFVLVCPARMVERKGLIDLILAIRFIDNRKVKLFIASSLVSGSEQYAEKIKNVILKYNLKERISVVFDQYFINDIPQLLVNCDAVVLPSHTEGFGMALIEGMASGLPIIGSNVGGIPEIIKHKKNGLLFESQNIEDLASKIKCLYHDNELSKKIKNAGRDIVNENFNLYKQAQQYIDVYQE